MINVNFDFRSDTPSGKDADTFSPTLAGCITRVLWSKPLQCGELLKLNSSGAPPYYLHHRLPSSASSGCRAMWRYRPSCTCRGSAIRSRKRSAKRSIGGLDDRREHRLSRPQLVDRKRTINVARAFHPRIKDRFDLTVECIRRHYLGEPTPLAPVLARYADFFRLFGDFAGYVDFFHLQDLVNEGASTVRFFAPFEHFIGSPVPGALDAYLAYRERAIAFIESRSRRIAAYAAEYPPRMEPPWASPRFEAVLAQAEAVGQREVLEELLAAGDRLGLYARPYVGSVMFTPPANRTRMLFTVSPETGGTHMWVSADAFEQFFSEISADAARRQLGPDGKRDLDQTGHPGVHRGLASACANLKSP